MDYKRYVEGLRDPLVHSSELPKAWQFHNEPHSIALSYALEAGIVPESYEDFAQVLANPSDLLELLYSKRYHQHTVQLDDTTRSALDRLGISLDTYISSKSNFSAMEIDNQFILGRKKRQTHVYPTGETLDYFLLEDEVSANMPITTLAFCFSGSRSLYLRKNGIRFFDAVIEAIRSDYLDFDKELDVNYEDKARGIILSHEEVEAELLGSDVFFSLDEEDREVMVEELSWQRLQRRGITQEEYLLFHHIRSKGSKGSISERILQNSQPFA